MIRIALALAALAAAGLFVAVAIDVGRWSHAHGRRPATLVGGVAEALLGTADDVTLRHAVGSFVTAEHTPYGFDNGQTQARARAEAEAELAEITAAGGAPDQASQADDLIGVLAWGGTSAPAGVLDPADRAVASFTTAGRLDPANVDAKTNLEIALRALQSKAVRRGPSPSSGPRGTGHSGAGAGTTGQGY